MPLPEKVIERLGREPAPETQGWATGALLFSGGMLFLAAAIYCGLAFGYEPYLQGQLAGTKKNVATLESSISPSQQSQLIDFYSQIANLQTLLKTHVVASQLFSWLEKNTEANVYFQSFALTSRDQVALNGVAPTEADINQQLAVFESSPDVSAVNVSNVVASPIPGGGWDFSVTLVMNPSVFLLSGQ